MDTFTHPITLHSPSGERSVTVEATVDLDLLFARFPKPLLERLGVQVDDDTRARPIGHVEAELDGQRSTIMCVFGDEDDPARIGRHTLDSFLLEADVDNQKLVPKTFTLIQHI